MKHVLALFLICSISFSFAQKVKTLNDEDICEIPASPYATPIDPVKEFKDDLELSIHINSIEVGREQKTIDLHFNETISDESSIIRIDKELAIRVSMGRIIDNGKKYYIYRIHLYRKVKGCWEEAYTYNSWTTCNLGVLTSGYAIGNQGSSTYIGFSGTIRVM